MHGVFFDQGHVIERARASIQSVGLADRAELVSGSFFESVPSGADAYFLRHIIHDWSDDPALRIFQNIRRAIPPKARLLIVEMIVPEGNGPSIAKSVDMTVMLL